MSNKKAKEALNQMKQEAANTVGAGLQRRYLRPSGRFHRRRDGEAHDRKLRERPFRQVTFPIPTPAAMPSAGRGRSFCLSTAKLAKPTQ